MQTFIEFIIDLIKKVFEFLIELPLMILEGLLSAIAMVIETIPVPASIQSWNLASTIPSELAWVLGQSGFGAALAAVGAGIIFRFMRRVLTLGIW